MASQMSSGFGSSSRTRSTFPHQKCYHNEIAPLRVVKHHGPTFGKRFYGCSYWHQTCGFFKWADGSDDVSELQELLFEKDTFIAELEMHNEMLTKKLKEVQGKNVVLQDQVDELSIENNETRLAMCSARADKRFFMALVLSWVLFAVLLLKY
ncbi:DNA topoisomerase 3-alpha [Bienertia sinuspersici]